MRRVLCAAGIAGALLCAACSSQGDESSSTTTASTAGAAVSTSAPASASAAASGASSGGTVLEPVDTLPGTTKQTGLGYRIAASSAFKRTNQTSSNDEPMIRLHHTSSKPGVQAVVSVFRDPDPASSLSDAVKTLVQTKRQADKATNITATPLTWPGAKDAVLVEWTAPLATTGQKPVAVRYLQLNMDTSSDLRLVVLGFAPVSGFKDSGVTEAMSTFRPT